MRSNQSLKAKIRETLKKWRRTMQKLKRGSLFKTSISTNRSTGLGLVDRLVNAANVLTFQIFAHFLILWSSPYPFKLKSPIFYAQCKGNFDFLVEIWPLSKYTSIWCIWHEIHAIRRDIHQEFIKQSLDIKEITPSCLLISTNCSSLRGFVKISASWFFVLTNSSVMSSFCAWSLRKWCLISICLI